MTDSLRGVNQFVANLRAAHGRAREAGARSLRVAGLNTLRVSNAQVPLEEADLERDGAVSVDEQSMRCAISYGRRADTADYAVAQHERMDFRHDAGRNAKFLERALATTRDQNLEIMGKAVREGMGT